MKWFKHLSSASDDEFLSRLEAEMGLEAYARWWKMLEVVAKQMDGTDRCSAEYPIERWQLYLSAKQKKVLKSFVEHCEKFGKISTELNGNILKITCPKLLELRDEYSRKSGATPDKVAPDTETDTEIDVPSGDKSPSGTSASAPTAPPTDAPTLPPSTPEPTPAPKPARTAKQKPSVTLDDLSVDHLRDWLAQKRSEGRYIHHDEYFIVDYFKDYCRSKGKKYEDYLAGCRNAFEWDSCQPKPGGKPGQQGQFSQGNTPAKQTFTDEGQRLAAKYLAASPQGPHSGG